MTNTLEADDLGEAGETLLANLCARAGLICNKSIRDRGGWDFVIEFPMTEPGSASLDARLPTRCLVQLKSTARLGAVRLKLSAAERLAKDGGPALIIVLRLRPSGEPIAGYLIHMLGSPLRRVLHRLRTADQQKRFDLNNVTITFDPAKHGVKFDAMPEGLKSALATACGADPAGYATEKQRQLRELGYEGGGLESQVLFWVESAEHFSDIMLGLAPIKPKCVETFDNRFGIRLPYTGEALQNLEELWLTPPSIGACTVAIRGAPLTPAAVFDAEMSVGPAPPGGSISLLITHADFTLKLAQGAGNFTSRSDIETTPRLLPAWISFARGLTYLASGKATIVLTWATRPETPLTLSSLSPVEGPYLDSMPEIVSFLEGWRGVTEVAGLSPNEPFSLGDIWEARTAALAVELFTRRPSRAWFGIDRDSVDGADEPIEAVYINTASFAGAALSYAVKVILETQPGNTSEYRSTAFTPLDARPAVADIQDYAEAMAEEHGLSVVLNPANLTELDPIEAAT